jgi:hypothetical protein
MKNKHLILLMTISLAGCSTLTKTQIKAVNCFAQTSQDFSQFPSKIITGLAEIRSKRGVFYANSLDNPRLHIQELDSIYSFKNENYAISEKVDITFKIIDKYAQSLLLLSSDKYVQNLQEQAQNFGIGIDSLITTYNGLNNVTRVPTSIGGAIGQLLAFGGKQYVRSKQAKEIKKFVPAADLLIDVMTDNLLEYLNSTTVVELIKNEEEGINSNYLSYLRQVKTVSTAVINNDTTVFAFNTKSTVANDHEYLLLKTHLVAVKVVQEQTIDASRDLRKAHKKLLHIIQKKQRLKGAIPEVQALVEGVKEMRKSIKKIEKPSNSSYERSEN